MIVVMNKQLTDWEGWNGTAADMANVVPQIMQEIGLRDDSTEPNERLIRHYVSVEILDRPTRVGKEAIFGFRQLLQFVSARILINDGWPLAKVAEQTFDVSEGELLRMATSYQPKTTAQELVKKFKGDAFARSEEKVSKVKSSSAQYVNQSVSNDMEFLDIPAFMRSHSEESDDKTANESALEQIGNKKGVVEKRAWHEISVTPWLRLSLQMGRLVRMDLDTAEKVGDAIKQVLIEEVVRRGERKK